MREGATRFRKEQDMHDEHGANVCLSSLMIGAFAGAGLALLMAPRSGTETRQLVSDKVREGADYARDLASRATDKGRHLVQSATEKGREAVQTATERGREALQTATERGREAVDTAGEYASTSADYRGV
jgi:gas vesicle protein